MFVILHRLRNFIVETSVHLSSEREIGPNFVGRLTCSDGVLCVINDWQFCRSFRVPFSRDLSSSFLDRSSWRAVEASPTQNIQRWGIYYRDLIKRLNAAHMFCWQSVKRKQSPVATFPPRKQRKDCTETCSPFLSPLLALSNVFPVFIV